MTKHDTAAASLGDSVDSMKAITIHQPWAGLIAIGAKRYETRGWRTNYRGPIAIHASKKDSHAVIKSLPHRTQISIYDSFYEHLDIPAGAFKYMPTGAVVATANLVECWAVGEDYQSGRVVLFNGEGGATKDVNAKEIIFGDYSFGRYAWELSDVKMLPEPIPAKGQQGLWNWNQ